MCDVYANGSETSRLTPGRPGRGHGNRKLFVRLLEPSGVRDRIYSYIGNSIPVGRATAVTVSVEPSGFTRSLEFFGLAGFALGQSDASIGERANYTGSS